MYLKGQKRITVYFQNGGREWDLLIMVLSQLILHLGKNMKLCPYTLFSEMTDLNIPKCQNFARKYEVRKVFLNKSQPDIYINKM